MFLEMIKTYFRYDWRYMDIKLSAEEVFQRKEGVCKDYCKLFSEMCRYVSTIFLIIKYCLTYYIIFMDEHIAYNLLQNVHSFLKRHMKK